jgi:opacity protein-like surface antigen
MAMNGVLVSGNADFHPHWGVKLELGYSRNFDAFQTGRTADMVTYMGGPVFYPLRRRGYNVYAELLLGGARETGVNFEADGTLVHGFVNRFAWAGGGGLQYRITPALSLRVGADYLRSSFFNSNVVPQGQSNLRTSLSVVYTFGRR